MLLLFPQHEHKIATKVLDFQAKISSIQAKNVRTRRVQRVQLFPALLLDTASKANTY